MSDSSARPARIVASIAFALGTGNAPGSPRQTGQTRVFGSPPNETGHPQNIFVLRLVSSVWISKPMTASHFSSTPDRRSLDTRVPP
jgi:hypothetical protein